MQVSVLGMGRMGRAIAGRLLGGGHQVTVWNRSPGRADELVASGAAEAASVDEAVGGADVVITMLADDSAALQVGPVVRDLYAAAAETASSDRDITVVADRYRR